MKKVIAIIGTLDTKGDEISYLKSLVEKRGHDVLIVDTGTLGTPFLDPDISREKVAEAGGERIEELQARRVESFAQEIMARGLKTLLHPLAESGKIHGVVAIGGGQGSIIVAPLLKSLPFGFPKILVSTKITQAGPRPYIGSKDVLILPPVADLAGINRLTEKVLVNAAGAISGMVEMKLPRDSSRKPLVVMSMNGTITDCGLRVKDSLEQEGYEVLVFHSIGTGGEALEEFVKTEEGIAGVIELAVNEIGNYLLGGLASSGPERLTSAGLRGIPQVIVPGSADFINFLGPETVPEKFRGRRIHPHNPQATIVRTNASDNRLLGKTIAEKLNMSRGPVVILWPRKGLSSVDKPDGPFWDPAADQALLTELTACLRSNIPIEEIERHINDAAFSKSVVETFFYLLNQGEKDLR